MGMSSSKSDFEGNVFRFPLYTSSNWMGKGMEAVFSKEKRKKSQPERAGLL
jgi:hypothetical protein